MGADEVRLEVGVGQEVLAGDLTLPPVAPVVETDEQRIERFVVRRLRVVAPEKRVAVGERRLPVDVAESVGALRRPRVGVERLAVPLRRVLELERQAGVILERSRVGQRATCLPTW